MENNLLYCLGIGVCACIVIWWISGTSGPEPLDIQDSTKNITKTLELLSQLVKEMDQILIEMNVNRADFSRYLNTNNIDPVKVWNKIYKTNLDLDFTTQLHLFCLEFKQIVIEFLSNGSFF